MPGVSSYHQVQGDVQPENFELFPGLLEGKVNNSSTSDMFMNTVRNNGSSQSIELEDGELTEGIEANDVSTLLEQFLEYEEKQGSLGCSSSSVGLLSLDTSPNEETIALKINSFAEAHALDFVFPHETKNNGTDSIDVEIVGNVYSPMNGETVHDFADKEPIQSGLEKHKISKMDKKCHVDNHSTDHNYACSGFPMRKAPQVVPETNGHSTTAPQVVPEINGHSTMNGSKPSPPKSLALDMEHENNKLSNRKEILNSRKRQSSCDKDSGDKKSRIPKRYRGPYCEDSSEGECSRSEGECSSSDDDKRYSKSSHSRYDSSDEYNDNRRKQRKMKHSYSSDDNNYRKGTKRRHSLYSDDSSDERRYSSSDEDCKNEWKCRYDPRQSESNNRHTSGSARDSGSRNRDHRRSRRPRSKDRSKRDSDGKKDKNIHDIELERKMGFKFDHSIKGTAKEERRIVYIGKISKRTTEDDIWRRFRPFGPIEKVTVHFRDKGDNYAFVTFFEYSSAAEAIERGNEDSRLPVLDICFGGRRKFCGGSYVDFDSNTSYLEEREISRPPSSDEMDFDTLLKMSQQGLKNKKESCR